MVTVILDNIRSVHNVGSLFRTCEGAGVSKLYLCGVTPTPLDRFGRVRSDIAKVALGTEEKLPWEYVKTTEMCIKNLKKEGYTIVAIEQDERSKEFKSFMPKEKIAFVFGEETKGLSKELLSMCDEVLEIPMHGEKESLNVSVAAGVILFGVER